MLNWRKQSDHSGEFYDGDKFFVAVLVRNNATMNEWYEFYTIDMRVDDVAEKPTGEFYCDGEPWFGDWNTVSYWVPFDELLGSLPKPEKKGAES